MLSLVQQATVVEVPYVQRLELEYHFPAYTGLERRRSKEAPATSQVLAGTEVRLHNLPDDEEQGRADCAEREGVGRAHGAGRQARSTAVLRRR